MMHYKEYPIEDKKTIDSTKLEVGFIPREHYAIVHECSTVLCADVLIKYENGFLLVKRDNVPAKGELWPIGGRLLRGISTEEGVRRKAKAECGLDLENLVLVGMGRTSFQTAPFDHGKGTDTVNFMYVAEGKGKLELDKLHSKPTIVNEEVFKQIRNDLHPYVIDFLELGFKTK